MNEDDRPEIVFGVGPKPSPAKPEYKVIGKCVVFIEWKTDHGETLKDTTSFEDHDPDFEHQHPLSEYGDLWVCFCRRCGALVEGE